MQELEEIRNFIEEHYSERFDLVLTGDHGSRDLLLEIMVGAYLKGHNAGLEEIRDFLVDKG